MLGTLLFYEQHPSGHVLYKAGDVSDRFYIIVKGSVRIEEPASSFSYTTLLLSTPPSSPSPHSAPATPDHTSSPPVTSLPPPSLSSSSSSSSSSSTTATTTGVIATLVLNEEEHFGDWTLMFKKPRSGSATCLSDCTFMCLNADGFHQFLQFAPELKNHFEALQERRKTLSKIEISPDVQKEIEEKAREESKKKDNKDDEREEKKEEKTTSPNQVKIEVK